MPGPETAAAKRAKSAFFARRSVSVPMPDARDTTDEHEKSDVRILSRRRRKIFPRHDLVLSFPGGIKYKRQERNASTGCLSAENVAEGYVLLFKFSYPFS